MNKEAQVRKIRENVTCNLNLFSEVNYIISRLNSELPREELFFNFEPKKAWFCLENPSIHGIAHETRILVLSELLSRMLIKSGTNVDQQTIRWAAITHDTQRLSDGIDIHHGQRSADWVLNNLTNLNGSVDVKKVAYLNNWHVPSDKFAPEMTVELKIFKDADALDRWRIEDLDVSYLRTEPAKKMTTISKYLYSASLELARYLGEFLAVLETAKLLNIIASD